MSNHKSVQKVLDSLTDGLFCIVCGCSIKCHKAVVPSTRATFNCKGCGKKCVKKPSSGSFWISNRSVKRKKTGEPFEGGGL